MGIQQNRTIGYWKQRFMPFCDSRTTFWLQGKQKKKSTKPTSCSLFKINTIACGPYQSFMTTENLKSGNFSPRRNHFTEKKYSGKQIVWHSGLGYSSKDKKFLRNTPYPLKVDTKFLPKDVRTKKIAAGGNFFIWIDGEFFFFPPHTYSPSNLILITCLQKKHFT